MLKRSRLEQQYRYLKENKGIYNALMQVENFIIILFNYLVIHTHKLDLFAKKRRGTGTTVLYFKSLLAIGFTLLHSLYG